MSNLLFSLNATMPVFLVMAVGWMLGKRKLISPEFCKTANRFVFQVSLPLLLFKDIASSPIREVLNWKFLIFCMVSTTISFFTIWWLSKLLLKDKSEIGAFVQASFRGSAAILGTAFIINMYGNSGMAPVMIIGAVPLFNIYSIIVLTFEGDRKEKSGIKTAFVNILKNPIIQGILVGIFFSITGWYEHMPIILKKSVNNIAVIASPLALLVIGASFEGKKALAKMKLTVVASTIKLLLLPAVFLAIAVLLGFRQQELIALLIMLGAPSTVTCYIMAVNMNHDGVLSSSIIVLTTLLSSVTITGWIYLLKSIGYI